MRWLLIAALAMAGGGGAAAGRTLEVGPGKQYAAPSQAAAAARDGDTVVIAAGRYEDCATWPQSDLTIEGASPDGTVLTAAVCQGKAIFVVSGRNVTVRNLALENANTDEGNAAGIRYEGTHLTVERVRFNLNQNGIMGGLDPQGVLSVSDSEFTGNGSCIKACAHGIYAGRIALLRVARSSFRDTRIGHHIKSRAARTEVVDSSISDGETGTASYSIDIPNGGGVLIAGNAIEKGPMSDNREVAISIGAEGAVNASPDIRIENNSFAVLGGYRTTFVRNLTLSPAKLAGNRLPGGATPLFGLGQVD